MKTAHFAANKLNTLTLVRTDMRPRRGHRATHQ